MEEVVALEVVEGGNGEGRIIDGALMGLRWF